MVAESQDQQTNRKHRKSLAQRLHHRWQTLWLRLLNWPLPVVKTYLVLTIGSLVVFGLIIGGLHYWIQHTSKLPDKVKDANEALNELYSYYRYVPWGNSIHTYFTRLAEENPDNPWPLLARMWMDYQLSVYYNLPLNFEAADQALAFPATDAITFAELARFYSETHSLDKLQQAAQKAIDADPNSPVAQYWQGQALKQHGNFADAQAMFEACAGPKNDDRELRSSCFGEILPATRVVTLTLKSDFFNVETETRLNDLSDEFKQQLAEGEPSIQAMRLTWGRTAVSSGAMYRSFRLYQEFDQNVVVENSAITSKAENFDYAYFWNLTYHRFDEPHLSFEMLPLTAYTLPTTITIIIDGTDVISASQPYQTVQSNHFIWQVNQFKSLGQNLVVSIRPNTFNRAKLAWGTHHLNDVTWVLLYGLPTVFGLIFLLQLRLNIKEQTRQNNVDAPIIFRLFHPRSLLSWLFELTLFAVALVTVIYPLWLIFWEGIMDSTPFEYLGYLAVLVVVLVRLASLDWFRDGYNPKYFIRLGGIIFIFYLAPRLFFGDLGLLFLLLALLIYRLFFIHNREWVQWLDWPRLLQLFSQQRPTLLRQILSLEQAAHLEQALEEQNLALAKGKIKPDNYNKTRQILQETIQQNKNTLTQLRQAVNLTEDIPPKRVLFGLGPQATPIGNALVAVMYGMIPYLIFLVLASWSEPIFRSLNIFGLFNALHKTVGVPWGPIFLFFFGFFFHVIRGDYGVTKALVFSLSLAVLNFIFQWLWWGDQLEGVEIWGLTIRLLVTFVFTGLMMDWKTMGFSWQQVRLSYDSPAFTTVVSVAATALTTILTGIATGTLNQLLSVAVQGTAAAFGVQSSLGPP